jgi:hypothetical protein
MLSSDHLDSTMGMKYEKENPGNMFLGNAGLSRASSPEPTALSDKFDTRTWGGRALCGDQCWLFWKSASAGNNVARIMINKGRHKAVISVGLAGLSSKTKQKILRAHDIPKSDGLRLRTHGLHDKSCHANYGCRTTIRYPHRIFSATIPVSVDLVADLDFEHSSRGCGETRLGKDQRRAGTSVEAMR